MDNKEQAIEIDEEKLRRMCLRIYTLERNNALTGEKSPTEMTEEIKKIIEKEAGKCY